MGVGPGAGEFFADASETDYCVRVTQAQREHGIAEIMPVDDEACTAKPRRDTCDQEGGDAGRVLHKDHMRPRGTDEQGGGCAEAKDRGLPDGSRQKNEPAHIGGRGIRGG